MTIDEAIKLERQEEHEQIANWLEEMAEKLKGKYNEQRNNNR